MGGRSERAAVMWLRVALALLLFGSGNPGLAQEQTVHSMVSDTTATKGWAVNYPKDRKVFCMSGLVWVFYSDGVNGQYRTSIDGVNWSAPMLFGPGGHFGHRFGCWFDGVYFHYAICTAALGADVRYRRGLPNSDGSITWSTAEQTAYDTPSHLNAMYPKVMVDSEGYPWISFLELIYQEPNLPPYDAKLIKASTIDGTWATESGFPFTLVHKDVDGYPIPVGVPLTDGKTFWFCNTYGGSSYRYVSRLWNGVAWEGEEVVVNPGSPYAFFNAVADGDDVHVVHGSGSIRYQKKPFGGPWSVPFVIDGSASGNTSLTLTDPGDVVVTWLDTANNLVRTRARAGGVWGFSTTLADESIELLADPNLGINLNTLIESSVFFRQAVVYSTGSVSPYKVKFAAVTLPVQSTETVRLGTPPNPNVFLPGQTSGPVLGATWDPVIDHSAFLPTAILDYAAFSATPSDIPTPFGTLLCALPLTGLQAQFASTPFAFRIPTDCSLAGIGVCCAGVSFGPGGLIELTNAIDIVLGTY